MPLTFAETPLYYKDSQGQYHRVLSGADMTGYRTSAAQDAIDANLMALGLTGASVGDLVRVNAVDANGKPTSWKHVPLCEIKTNPNLLDNWYFVGGGSQLGDGVFPINQREQTVWTGGDRICIDRWVNTNGTLELIENGLHWASGASNFYFAQRIYKPAFAGKLITASVLLSDGTLMSGSAIAPVAGGSNANAVINNDTIRCYFIHSSAGLFTVGFAIKEALTIQAVKLELGSEQTLAHNEGTEESPVWVLNEIPDYREELAKCQRYLCNVDFTGACYSTTDSASAYTVIATPVKMAGQTHLVNASYKVACRFESSTIQNCTLEMKATRGNGVGANIYPPSGVTFPSGKPGAIVSGETLLSCEP